MTRPRLVRAAGCVVWRDGDRGTEVLLVHRPRWDDWSFPKGKLDRGEETFAAAVREVEEETGLRVRLGRRLPDQHYAIAGGTPKVVAYWAARAQGDGDISAFVPNAEIDDLRWTRVGKARRKLDYERDRELLDDFLDQRHDSSPLLIVRHAEARARKSWRHDDSERPLKAEGKVQARELIELFAAYGITRLVSSDAVRCVDTLLPYANSHSVRFALDTSISEEGMAKGRLERRVGRLMAGRKRVAICSHRPVLPAIFEAVGLDPVALDPAGVVVVHRRRGTVVDTELYP